MTNSNESAPVCIVLGSDAIPSIGEKIQDALVRKWPELNPNDVVEDGRTLSIATTQGDLVFGRMPAPFSWEDLRGPCEEGTFWLDAVSEVKRHTSHLVLTVLASEATPVERFSLLTRFAAATMVVSPSALGVYMGHAGIVVPKKLFIDLALTALPQAIPLHLWIRFYVGWDDEGLTSSGCTQGMRSFGLREIEAVGTPETPAELGNRFEGLAEYILNGAAINDGDTVGVDKKERILVRVAPSHFGHDGDITRLVYD